MIERAKNNHVAS